MDEHAFAVVKLDRESSHLSEQLALKSFVPVVALSDDMSLTLPIFRGSSGSVGDQPGGGAAPAEAGSGTRGSEPGKGA
jgi:hypothetical protein